LEQHPTHDDNDTSTDYGDFSLLASKVLEVLGNPAVPPMTLPPVLSQSKDQAEHRITGKFILAEFQEMEKRQLGMIELNPHPSDRNYDHSICHGAAIDPFVSRGNVVFHQESKQSRGMHAITSISTREVARSRMDMISNAACGEPPALSIASSGVMRPLTGKTGNSLESFSKDWWNSTPTTGKTFRRLPKI
jgi:hypothetical protein